MGKRHIQGYVSEKDYEEIMNVIVEIQRRKMIITKKPPSLGDVIKECIIFYGEHLGIVEKGAQKEFVPFYYKDIFFEELFNNIKLSEKKGIGSYNNQTQKWVEQDIVKIMDTRNEINERNNIWDIYNQEERWKIIKEYINKIYKEYQEWKNGGK